MKRGLILLFALVILGSMASAANSYDLSSFDKEPTQIIVIGQGDEVRFNLFNSTHSVVFEKVVQDVGFRFSGHAYINQGPVNEKFPMTGFATKTFSSHMDVNKDNVSDLIIGLYKTEVDEKTNETYADVIFKLENNVPTAHAVAPANNVGVTEKSRSKYLIPVAVVAFILVLVLIARKTGKKEEQKQAAQ